MRRPEKYHGRLLITQSRTRPQSLPLETEVVSEEVMNKRQSITIALDNKDEGNSMYQA